MSRKSGLLFTLLIVALATLACQFTLSLPKTVTGKGDVTQEDRSVSGFDSLEINGLGDVTVELGEEESLTIEAEDNLLPYLETYVRGSTLVIEVEDGRTIIPTKPVKFYLTVVSLEKVAVAGLGNISLPELEADQFSIDISGAGNIEIDGLYADSFRTSMSGLGDLNVNAGQVSTQTITISGSGKYSAAELNSENATVSISGLGSATVRASQSLKVTISGSGNVNYYGDPQVDSEISGVGKLNRAGD